MAIPGRGSKRFDQDADDKKFGTQGKKTGYDADADDSVAAGIKRPGRLTKLVGGKPADHMAKVNQLAKNGTPLEKKEANYYKNVLRKGK